MGEPGSGAAPPIIRFHLPAPPLRPLITSYYIIETPAPIEDRMMPEWANIRFSLAGEWRVGSFTTRPLPTPRLSSLFGPTDRARPFATDGGALLGVGLTPCGWDVLIGGDASALANRIEELGARLGLAGDDLARSLADAPDDAVRVATLDRVFGDHAAGRAPCNPKVHALHDALVVRAEHDVADLAARIGVSQQTLGRLSLRSFGFTAKRLLRRQRFLRTLAVVRAAPDQPLATLIDPDYHDLAHFMHDFRAFVGVSPRAYFKLPRTVLREATVERTRVVGAPVQGLHRPDAPG